MATLFPVGAVSDDAVPHGPADRVAKRYVRLDVDSDRLSSALPDTLLIERRLAG